MKKINAAVCAIAAVATATAFAQGQARMQTRKGGAAVQRQAAAEGPRREKAACVAIDVFPKLGRAATLNAPSVSGETTVGRTYSKPRKWIVLEAKYTTFAKWQDQLTFTWHVLLDTKTATAKDRTDIIAPYSYYTASVTYQNIPQGSHTASVCLPPSHLERFGEPRAVGLVIKDGEEILAAGCESQIAGIQTHPKEMSKAFWNIPDIMNKKNSRGEPVITQRQGLLDRSKTIWALVNPNDYEQTAP
jgi:hypothetical protein